jgi:Putative auto-transporter adhesin, head GIN domain
MKNLFAVTTAILSLILTSCDFDFGIRGSGKLTTVQQSVGTFSEIDGRGGMAIEWHSGAPSLSVTTDDNLMSYFEAKTVGNRLQLRMRETVRPTHGIKIAVTSPSLTGIKMSGAAKLTAHGITGPSFAVQTKGAATIVVDGIVDQLLADLTGASELKAKNLQAKTVEISTTGASESSVNASEKLRVAITGAGELTYSGNPATVEKKITGAGKIHHQD